VNEKENFTQTTSVSDTLLQILIFD